MKPIPISFVDSRFAVEAPDSVAPDIAAFFALASPVAGTAPPTDRAVVTETAPGRFSLAVNDGAPAGELTRGELIAKLAAEAGVESPVAAGAVALKAGAVGWGENAILVIGHDGSGKSALVAWLIDKGFAYLADNSVVLTPDASIAGFPGPLSFKAAKLSHVAGLPTFHDSPSLPAGERMMICPDPTWLVSHPTGAGGLIIDVNYVNGAALSVDSLDAETATLRLLESTLRVVIPTDGEYARIAALVRKAPVLKLTYGNFSQLEGVLDFLARVVVETDSTPADVAKFLQALPRAAPAAAPKTYPMPAKTERTLRPKLTIGMATYDDFDGTYFTIQAIRMYHPEVVADVEFVVIDNRPDGPCGEPLKHIENSVPNYRYIPYPDAVGTAAAKDRVFREAAGDYVLCVDCHVFLVPGALRRLLNYFEENPQTGDLLQGPLLYDNLQSISTHLDIRWRTGFYGTWATMPGAEDPDAPPFPIPAQGLGLLACRREAWLGFNPAFRGFGGEEIYLHEKYRRAGHQVLCLPFLRWMHRFGRPLGTPYVNAWEQRIRNYVIGFTEVGLPIEPLKNHFREYLGEDIAERIFAQIREELGIV